MTSLTGTNDPAADELDTREPGRWGSLCRKCWAPLGIHCPGCGSCNPVDVCALLCPGSEHEGWVERAAELVDDWIEEHS